ncbi:hypothetical protein HYFRA_00009944 [Hymenoscyphus fraxineus]|uniref:Hemerythrin-like domain-containing protein n=1 Tax=Hymenoscyphus fraxineus TaxID=746836 RepID=A0A9N9PYF2_9HELO|nr:hypothetical protein HYFRA_00009944 [Hymenoscyphus fraxineus]
MHFLASALATFFKSGRNLVLANRGFGSPRLFAGGEAFRGLSTAGYRYKAYDTMAGLPNESDILGTNEVREEAVTEIKDITGECDGKDMVGEKVAVGLEEKEVKEAELKKLSAAEFRAYNSMAEHMEYFHNHFRQTWTLLATACANNRRPANTSLKQFLSIASQFLSHLETHHAIEEQHIFPVLKRKMIQFQDTATLLQQHREIHKGMDGLEQYIREVRSGERELVLKEMEERLQWGEVLWKHLDEEVKTLGAENMRKYWTVEEMRRMPM